MIQVVDDISLTARRQRGIGNHVTLYRYSISFKIWDTAREQIEECGRVTKLYLYIALSYRREWKIGDEYPVSMIHRDMPVNLKFGAFHSKLCSGRGYQDGSEQGAHGRWIDHCSRSDIWQISRQMLSTSRATLLDEATSGLRWLSRSVTPMRHSSTLSPARDGGCRILAGTSR